MDRKEIERHRKAIESRTRNRDTSKGKKVFRFVWKFALVSLAFVVISVFAGLVMFLHPGGGALGDTIILTFLVMLLLWITRSIIKIP